MKFIKIAILILVLSTNLMLGQKNDARVIKNRCGEKPIDLRILQTQPNFVQIIIENCEKAEIKTGAFFQFAAF